jgi:crossover junction endodeoxyribonuclease RusA
VTINLTLPYPPSANRLWRNSRGRTHKSTEYCNWLNHAGYVARAQRPGKICGPYKISITAVRPDKRRRDLGNLEKPISDLLQSLGVVEDDCNAEMICVRWVTAGEGITVHIEPAGVE